MTIVDAAPMWLSRLVARVFVGKEYSQALGESYEEVVEETGGTGGTIVEWAKDRFKNILIYLLAIIVILIIIYVIIRKLLKK